MKNINRKITQWMMLGILTLVFAVPAAFANHGEGHYGSGHKSWRSKGDVESKLFMKAKMALHKADELGLSDAQKTQIEDLLYESKKNKIRQKAEIKTLELDIWRQLKADPINLETINPLVDQKYELKKQKTKSAIAAIAKLKQTFTPEQQVKMKELYKQGMHGSFRQG